MPLHITGYSQWYVDMHQSFALAGDIIAFQWPWHPPPPPCEAPHTALSLEVASTVHWHCACSSDDCSSDSLQERGRTISVESSVSSKCCNTVQKTKAVVMEMFMWLTYLWSWDLTVPRWMETENSVEISQPLTALDLKTVSLFADCFPIQPSVLSIPSILS